MCVNGITAVLALPRPSHRYARPSSHLIHGPMCFSFQMYIFWFWRFRSACWCRRSFFAWDFNFILRCTRDSKRMHCGTVSRQRIEFAITKFCLVKATYAWRTFSRVYVLVRCVLIQFHWADAGFCRRLHFYDDHFSFSSLFIPHLFPRRPNVGLATAAARCHFLLMPPLSVECACSFQYKLFPLPSSVRAESREHTNMRFHYCSAFTCHLPFTIRLHAPFLCVFS